jgi:hypothetical protein
VIVSPLLVALNFWISAGTWWVVFAILPWGFALAMHFLSVFGFLRWLGPDWERREFQKRMQAHKQGQTDKR